MNTRPGSISIKELVASTALACLVSPSISIAAHGPWPHPFSPQDSRQDPADDDLLWLEAILQSSSNAPEIRRGAAERLLRLDTDASHRILDRLLRTGDEQQAMVILDALEAHDQVPLEMAEPLLFVLQASQSSLHSPVSRLLARTGRPGLEGAIAIASDTNRSDQERVGAVYALGSFREPASAQALIDLLQVEPAESETIINEVCLSLERLSGVRYGARPQLWIRWWDQYRDKPLDKLLQIMVQNLSEQLADESGRVDELHTTVDMLSRRLQELYSEYLLTLDPERRQQAIAQLLDDPMVQIRLFAVSQVERLLRNAQRPSDEVVLKLNHRLSDDEPELRIRSAKLLGDLGVEDLPQRLAALMPSEVNPNVNLAWLAILESSPRPEFFDEAIRHLQDPELADSAARLLTAMHDAEALPDGWQQKVQPIARQSFEGGHAPGMICLLALAGDQEDLASVQLMLEDPRPLVRQNAADGMRRRGLTRPLLAYARDPVIYPIVLKSLGDHPEGLSTLAQLLELPPGEEHEVAWLGAARRIAMQLPLQDRLDADEMLSSTGLVDPPLRIELLEAVLAGDIEAIDTATRLATLDRISGLLVKTGKPEVALALIEESGLRDDPLIKGRLFEAALLSGDFALAQDLHASGTPWIEQFKRLVLVDAEAATILEQEMLARFETTLTEEEQARFESARSMLAERIKQEQSVPVQP